jgi:hypothetical protein
VKPTWLHIVYLLYCAEAGVYLLLVPWSVRWVPMARSWPDAVQGLFLGGAARGVVSAIGGLMLLVCAVDLGRFCRALRSSP